MKRLTFILAIALVSFVWLASAVPVEADTFTVTNTNDSGTGSLRQAINDAYYNPGLDVIAFNIPGTGPHTIQPQTGLMSPGPVIIDGYTQPGAAPASATTNAILKIELDGSAGGYSGLTISAGNSTVRGLVINRFTGHGIELRMNGGNLIEGNFIGTDVVGSTDLGNAGNGVYIYGVPNNTIGGGTPASRNVISGNERSGVNIFESTVVRPATENLIQGNYIGTDVSGNVSLGNSEAGVEIFNAPNNTVGGTTTGAGNVISGNGNHGVYIVITNATGNLVQGNYIGTNAAGIAKVGNGTSGVEMQNAPDNTIGGMAPEERNIISGNRDGVKITGSDSTGNLVQGNFIGTNASGTDALGNTWAGLAVYYGSNNTLTGNTVSNNIQSGIKLYNSSDNQIYNNNFMDNSTQALVTGGSGNVFNLDKPVGGNYWSDWCPPEHPDDDGDGFVDLPYVFTGGQDYLPWAYQDGLKIKPPAEATEDIIEDIEEMDLPKGTQNSLVSKLKNAIKSMDKGQDNAAAKQLNAFIKQVKAQRGKKITGEQADALIAAAKKIIAML